MQHCPYFGHFFTRDGQHREARWSEKVEFQALGGAVELEDCRGTTSTTEAPGWGRFPDFPTCRRHGLRCCLRSRSKRKILSPSANLSSAGSALNTVATIQTTLCAALSKPLCHGAWRRKYIFFECLQSGPSTSIFAHSMRHTWAWPNNTSACFTQ